MSLKDIMSKLTPEKWREVLLRRKMGQILEAHKTGWVTNDEAKDMLLNAFEQYCDFREMDKLKEKEGE